MATSSKRPKKPKQTSEKALTVVSDPQAVYARKTTPRTTSKRQKQKGYDAKRSSGMIPGIAERMKEYLKTMRDDR
ncbi:MAG: hypothetical protein IPJ87_16860 [Flavobacteriales bacterium]|jgi:hypothetical protein|nr:hypothetical protein [Flavobacteriales bacterium]MBK7943516.1 hypothetical protein [Flavobacteriales bacterium]MBK9699797.1 hypothetical protein [Flavobacteriales bacterium]